MQLNSFEIGALVFTLISAGVGLAYALNLRVKITALPQGTDKMKQIAAQIQEGAMAYLHRQFKTIAYLVVAIFVLLVITAGSDLTMGIYRSLAFLLGCAASGLTGYVGMTLAVRGNVRCANAARTSLMDAFSVAFNSGAVAGMFTVTMGLVGATVIFMIFRERATDVLLGFGFGGCLLALFMRVGGGIYTKAADVVADLVGKVEAGIPEDDPRNAAVIADNVGDNVGDCAGMAADIFESYEITLVASMILALAHATSGADADWRKAAVWIMFPIIVRAIGVLTSIVGIALARMNSESEHPLNAITRGFVWSAVLSAIGFFLVAFLYVGAPSNDPENWWRLFLATVSGLVLAVAMYKLTEYYTSGQFPPVKIIAKSTQTGSATTILSGISEGMESSVYALLVICGCLLVSVLVFGTDASAVDILYGVSLCGLGMLTTTGVIISMDTFGPVADNAQGITEMASLEDSVENVELLDAVGNTTKAATKGIAIASAVIAAIALYGSFLSKVAGGGENVSAAAVESLSIRINEPMVFIGMLIGGSMPFLFSSMTIRAVSRAAFDIINEVRRQFREIPGLREGVEGVMPESSKVVDICTTAALRELTAPGLLAVLSPVIVGLWFGWEGLGGYLAGIIVVGQLLAVFMCNAGGAWDNAKKVIEDGAYGGKGSDAHKAGVVGDTVGDPFKDTAGPALNPLIKVMNTVGLLIAPVIVLYAKTPFAWIVGLILAVVIAGALIWSKRETSSEETVEETLVEAAAATEE